MARERWALDRDRTPDSPVGGGWHRNVALIDRRRGYMRPVGWFADIDVAECVVDLLNREERLKLYVGPTLRVRRAPPDVSGSMFAVCEELRCDFEAAP